MWIQSTTQLMTLLEAKPSQRSSSQTDGVKALNSCINPRHLTQAPAGSSNETYSSNQTAAKHPSVVACVQWSAYLSPTGISIQANEISPTLTPTAEGCRSQASSPPSARAGRCGHGRRSQPQLFPHRQLSPSWKGAHSLVQDLQWCPWFLEVSRGPCLVLYPGEEFSFLGTKAPVVLLVPGGLQVTLPGSLPMGRVFIRGYKTSSGAPGSWRSSGDLSWLFTQAKCGHCWNNGARFSSAVAALPGDMFGFHL
eukprot:superscaffoldBa00004611_g19178